MLLFVVFSLSMCNWCVGCYLLIVCLMFVVSNVCMCCYVGDVVRSCLIRLWLVGDSRCVLFFVLFSMFGNVVL